MALDRKASNRVLIAGAGPVGLCLALQLARRGIAVTIVERLADLQDQPRRAGTIHAATLEMLDDLGLYDALAARGLKAPQVHYWDGNDPEPVAVFDHAVLGDDVRFPYALQCDRLKVIDEAGKALDAFGHVELRLATEMTALRQTADGVVATVQTDGRTEEIAAAYLVGCEGARSLARKTCGIEFEGFAFPDRTMTLSVDYDFAADRDYSYRNYIIDPDLWANLFKWTDLWRVVLPANPDADPDALLDDDAIAAQLETFHPTGKRYDVVSKSLYTVQQRVAKTFRAGRVLLAGDAAHVNSPIGAMGMNSGIHDAVSLGDKLARVMNGEASEDVLDLYVRQRRHAAVAHVQAMSIRNKKLLSERDPAARGKQLDDLRATADDPKKAREFMLRASLVQSVREAAAIN